MGCHPLQHFLQRQLRGAIAIFRNADLPQQVLKIVDPLLKIAQFTQDTLAVSLFRLGRLFSSLPLGSISLAVGIDAAEAIFFAMSADGPFTTTFGLP